MNLSTYASDRELAQQDAVISDRIEREARARPICILKMLASDPNLNEDMARTLDVSNVKAEVRKYLEEPEAPTGYGEL